MLKNKKEENKNKRNLAIGATGLASTGLGAAYLLSRKKPTKLASKIAQQTTNKATNEVSNLAPKPFQLGNNQPKITTKTSVANPSPKPFQLSQLVQKPLNIKTAPNAPKTLGSVENLISKNIDKSPVDIGVEKVTGLKKKTANIWDKVAEKLDNLPSVKQRRRGQQLLTGSKPPKGLLRPGYDLPNIDWETPVERTPLQTIGEKIRAKRQGLLTGTPTPKTLPMARISANIAVKGYRRKDGTFVSAYHKNIDKVLREKRLKELDDKFIQDETIIAGSAKRTEKVFRANSRLAIAEKIREHIKKLLEKNVDDIQAQTYTKPVILESIEDSVKKETTEDLKQAVKNKYRNVGVRRERVYTLKRQADELAKELEQKAEQAFADRKKTYTDRVNELAQKIKKYEPELFEKTLSPDDFELQLKDLQENLNKTLNDPFAPNYFDDSVEKIEELKKQLTTELGEIKAKENKPQQFLEAVDNMFLEIENLKKEYRKTLEDTYAANEERVSYLREQLKQEKNILENLTETDITSDFLTKERSSLLVEINKRANRQFFGRTSNVERSLNGLRSRVYNQRTTIRNKIKAQNQNFNLQEYKNTILELQKKLSLLPRTRRNLTRSQRALLRETESFPKTYKKLYAKLFTDIENLHKFEKEYMSRYTSLVKEITRNEDDIFSNQTFEEYMEKVSTSAEKVEIADITFQENVQIVNKIYDPNEVVTRYLDLINRVKDLSDVDLTRDIVPFTKEKSAISLDTVAQRKKVIMQGGYIDGKKYDGILVDLKINTDASQIKTGLLNSYGEKYIAMKSSVVDYNDSRLAELADEYLTSKKRLLKAIDNSMLEITENIDYDTWVKNPEIGKVLGKINENMRKYNDAFGTQDISTSFFKQKQKIEDMRGHLTEIKRVKPQFVVENGQIKLNTIIMTDMSSVELNKAALEKIELDYSKVVGKTRSKRTTIANLYYNLDKAGIKVEGKDNIFQHLRGGVEKLKENERLFFDSLSKNEQIALRNFSNFRLDEHFQKYYYINSLSYALGGSSKNLVTTEDVSRQLGLIKPNIFDHINEYVGRNKPVDLQKRKLKEVQTILRDLKSLTSEDIKLTAFMTIDGQKIPFLNGLMGVENLPAILPGEQYRNRNFLVRKLQKILGVRENGTPLYNARLARILSGIDITDRESLKKLLSDIQDRYYGESDLNTLYMAKQLNTEYLHSYDSSLYLYNFSQNEKNIVTF